MNRMSMPSWDRIKAVFAEACELPAEQVPAFLDRVCEGDAELRREVESLLAARSGKQVATGGAARELAAASTMRATVITEGAGTVIGPYKLLQLIGEGGFGSVFLAEQTHPVRRRVAVKIIKLGMDTKQVIARFEAERQALALMDHPHIAKVLDGGATPLTERGGGRPYFVMEYVVGDAITAFADAHKLTIRDRLDLFQQVCSAVQHAHTKGIIHRDLKPGNVLVTMVDGKPFAKVIDFGIAKATAGPGGLTDKTLFTEHRQLIGTPEYMSPEQAEGSPDIDTRTDVYALGVLLYELLTGETPFDGARLRSAAYAEIQRIIKEEEPLSPSQRLSRSLNTLAATAAARQSEPDKLRASVHGELDWIVMRALDKERGRRYESANSLADDVRRHLAGEAVVAAPVSNTYRLRKFVRKNRGPVVAVSAVILALVAGGSVAAWQAQRAARIAASLRQEQADVRANVLASINSVFESNHLPSMTPGPGQSVMVMSEDWGWRINRSIDGNSLDIVGLRDDGTTETPATTLDVLTAASHYNWLTLNTLENSIEKLSVQTNAAEWSSYAANFALAQSAVDRGSWPEARHWTSRCPEAKRDWEWQFLSQQLRSVELELVGHSGAVNSVRFSRDGTRLATASSDGTARVWDASTGRVVGMLSGHAANVNDVGFSPDGSQLVTASSDGVVRVWDIGSETTTFVLAPNVEDARTAFFSADGSRILTCDDKGVRVWSAIDGKLLSVLDGHSGTTWSVALSADEKRVVSTAYSEIVRVWDLESSTLDLELKTHTDWVRMAEFNPSGDRLVTASFDGTGRVWDAKSGSVISTLVGHSGEVAWAQFSADGTRVLTGASDGTARMWEAESGKCLVVLGGHRDGISSARFSPDGQLIATASSDGNARIWDAASGEILAQLQGHTDQISHGEFSPDGRKYATASYDGTVRIWDIESRLRILEANGPETVMKTGRWRSSSESSVRLRCDAVVGSGADKVRFGLTLTTPDGTRRIVGGADKTVRFYEAKDGKPTLPATVDSPDGVYREVAVFRMPEAVTNLQMTGDGTRLIIHLEGGSARVWDIRDPEERRKDLQAEWAERVPAAAYLDTLWATDTPDDKLRDAVINDTSLSPLRRLVAAEMLEERLEDDRIAADEAFERLKQAAVPEGATTAADPASITSAVRAAAAVADLPHRVKARVIALAAEWQYVTRSVDVSEQLGLERAKRELAEADMRRLGEAMLHEADQLMKQTSAGLGFTADAPERFRSAARMFGAVFGENDSRALEARAWGLVAAMNASDTERYDLDLVASAIDAYAQAQSSNDADAMRMGVALALIPRYRQAMEWFKTNGGMQVIDDGQRRNIGMLCIGIYMSTLTQWGANESAWSLHLGEVVSDCDEFANAPIFSGLWVDQEAALICAALASHRRNETVEALVRLNRAVELRSGSIAAPAAVRISYGGREQGQNALQILVRALVHQQLASSSPESLAAVGEVDKAADPALKAPLAADEHRQRAREALARAKALMLPAADGTPSPWANDEDAKALIAEAEALIGGAP